jgi:hypothetical protein
MNNGLYYYKLVSEYPNDITKNCKLTINEIDQNFKTLKDNDIKSAEYVKDEECNGKGTLIITKNDGEQLIVPMDSNIASCKNLTYDFSVEITEDSEKGTNLTLSYKDDEGENIVTLENILTSDNLIDIIGSDILTKVISDNTLKGLGTITSPLGIANVEKTGMLAPAIEMLDLTNGDKLPEDVAYGTRYVTKEYISDYGYLYNYAGVEKISQLLDNEYDTKQIYKEVSDRKYYWRVPSKSDWDKFLNSIEPCEYQNHDSIQCHKELGKYAGKFLKSSCGWIGQEDCSCIANKPYTSHTVSSTSVSDNDNTGGDNPNENEVSPIGIDKYGMTILPSGKCLYGHGTPRAENFKEEALFWTTSHVYDDETQDLYVKVFDYEKSGVYQVAECIDPYYSVRLVKDFDGNNYFDTEYIDGVMYTSILMPETKQIWLSSNFANTNGFVQYNDEIGNEIPEVLTPNNGEGIDNERIEMFINDYNGRYWEKKVMNNGDTIVIENPTFDSGDTITKTVCWYDEEEVKHCVEVEIPKIEQNNIEYRVYITDEGCNKELINTDDLVVERVINAILPMLEKERFERIESDEALSGAIDTERTERIAADEALNNAIDAETNRATSAETALQNAIDTERSERVAADEALSGAIDTERTERIAADNALSGAIDTERTERIAADEALSGAIDTLSGAITRLDEKIDEEISRATSAETELRNDLNTEIERATDTEAEISGLTIDTTNEYQLSVAVDEGENLVLESKDGDESHFIKIKFDGNFGEI